MGFSAETRKQALIASARHCCVCHRYKGVRVEVHHIVPQSKGGTDEFDNAIVLCFDCHCDAGHYNPSHPRGTKFSADELSAARDKWCENVRRSQITSPVSEDILYCQYLLCRNVEAFREILVGEFSRLPFQKALLVENKVLSFQRAIINAYSRKVRRLRISRETFKDLASYCRAFPDARQTDRSSISFSWYETVRTPSLDEMERIGEQDEIALLLHRGGVRAEEIAMAVGYSVEPDCGGADDVFGEKWFQEDFRFRQVWGIFLVATNESNRRVRLKSLLGHIEKTDALGYRPFEQTGGEPCESLLPIAALSPGMTALIPLGTVLAPFESIPYESGNTTTQWLGEGEGYHQDFSHVTCQTANRFHLLGPLHRPSGISLEIDGCSNLQEVHDLNLTNIYLLDRDFAVGSCPHVFFLMNNGKCVYGGEIFTRQPGELSVVDLNVPDVTKAIMIAELQKERTYLKSICIGSDILLQDKWLEENNVVMIAGVAGKVLTLRGYYTLERTSATTAPSPSYLNETVCRFMALLEADNAVLATQDLQCRLISHPTILSL
jgi:HNH endonuclease